MTPPRSLGLAVAILSIQSLPKCVKLCFKSIWTVVSLASYLQIVTNKEGL